MPESRSGITDAELAAMNASEDWIKGRTWDIYPPTVETLLLALNVEYEPPRVQRAAVQHFMTTPAARAMPPNLRAELKKQRLIP